MFEEVGTVRTNVVLQPRIFSGFVRVTVVSNTVVFVLQAEPGYETCLQTTTACLTLTCQFEEHNKSDLSLHCKARTFYSL